MDRFGAPVLAEGEAPYGGTHILFTNLEPQSLPPLVGIDMRPHQSTARDDRTPLELDGVTPKLLRAWRYVLRAGDADEELAHDQAEQNKTTVGLGGGTRH